MSENELKTLYALAKQALADKDNDSAINLLKQILVINENYRDASRLLAQTVKMRRQRWFNHPLLWGTLGMAVIIGLGIWLAPRLERFLANQIITPTIRSSDTPIATVRQTKTTLPTETLVAPTATSMPLTWKRLSIGQEFPRDKVTTIAIDPNDPDVVYIGTANAGIYKSIDGGLSWQPRQNGLEQANITSLLIDPQKPQTLYAGTKGLIFKTMDGGNVWFDITPDRQSDMVPGEAYALVMDQENSQHLYLSRPGQQPFATRDGGLHWESLTPPCGWETRFLLAFGETVFLSTRFEDDCVGLYYFKQSSTHFPGPDKMIRQVDPEGGERLYLLIGSQNNSYSQLHVSMDGGRTWDQVKIGCSALATDNQGNAYTLCDGKLSQLSSWQRVGTPPVKMAHTLLFSPGIQNVILLGGEYGVYISRDNGTTWNKQNNGLGIRKVELKLRPEHSDMYLQDFIQFDIGQDCGLFRSNDYGRNWELLKREMDPYSCGLSFGPHGDTLFWHSLPGKISEDGGETWRETALGGYIPHPFRENWFYRPGSPTKLSHSSDGGNTWNLPEKDLNTHAARLFFSNSEGIIYLVTSYIVYASTDDGQSWQDCERNAAPALTDTSLALDPQDSQHLFLATWGKGVLISNNGCQSWQESNTGLGSLFINTLAIDPNNPDTIYAGTDGGAYVSTDSGQTWSQINDGLLGATVIYSIVVDKDNNVYAATPYGIFKLEGK
jgi:photosystem II stability/assembly factor-like uncharacterized protein